MLYETAKALVGEAAIAAAGRARTTETRRDWREHGVPWEIVGPLLLRQVTIAQMGAAHSLPGNATFSAFSDDEVACMTNAQGRDAFSKLALVWRNRVKDPATWETVMRVLDLATRPVGATPAPIPETTQEAAP